jgi:hypothetical protein
VTDEGLKELWRNTSLQKLFFGHSPNFGGGAEGTEGSYYVLTRRHQGEGGGVEGK